MEHFATPPTDELLGAVNVDGIAFGIDPPARLTFEREGASNEGFIGTVADLGLTLSGADREQLIADFEEQVAFLFREFVDADPSELSEDAQERAALLRSRVRRT